MSILVSVITPILNGEKYLEGCVNSVLNQTYPNIEHVFADGGSTDGTIELLEHFHRLFPDKIKYYSEVDSNPAEAANRGITLSQGQIIGILGVDDTYQVDTIQSVVELFEEDVNFLFGSTNYIKNGRLFKTVIARQPKKDELINGRFYVYGPSMFFRRKLWDEIGQFITTKDYAIANDIDFLIRVSDKYHLHHTTRVLSNFGTRPWLLSGKSWERSYVVLKATYNITKSYGGKHTWTSRVYFIARVIEFFRPVLQPLYTLVDKVLMLREKYIA